MSILVNSSWINPQIDFLLWIQNIRLHVGTGLDLFFLKATMFGEFFLSTLLISVIYWCIDSRAGVYLFSLNSISLMFSQLFKMMACVYRPWILNDKIKPVEAAMRFASGYSEKMLQLIHRNAHMVPRRPLVARWLHSRSLLQLVQRSETVMFSAGTPAAVKI